MTKTVGANRKTFANGTLAASEKASVGSQANKKTRLDVPNDVLNVNPSDKSSQRSLSKDKSPARSPVTTPTPAPITQNLIKSSAIFKILSKKERTFKTLNELNYALKSKESLNLLNVNDPILDGTFLHFLTQSAQSNDEYNKNNHLFSDG